MFLDIAIGIFSAIFTANIFDLDLSWPMIAVGIIFALIPDIDFAYDLLKIKKLTKLTHSHRIFPHQPLIIIPIIFIASYSILGSSWSFLAVIAILGHLIHDSIGIGWGIQWLYPFSTKFFAFAYIYQPPNKPKIPGKKWGLIYSWEKEEIKNLENNYGDPDWIKNIYLKFHPFAIFELSFFVIAILFLFFR